MIRRYTVALMQMDTQNDKGKNLETACAWIDEAAAKGAKLICFPEVMNLIGKNIGEGGGREEIPGYTTERLCAKAKEHGVYIHGGSITQALPGEKRSAHGASRGAGYLCSSELYDADGKGSLGGSSAGAGDRERLLHRGTGTDWTETGVCGIRKQPGGRSVGNGDCTVKGCTGDHLCGD